MKKTVYIVLIFVFLGLAGQSITSWFFTQKFETVLVEEEAKKNGKSSELDKEKYFEVHFKYPEPASACIFMLILKENFQTALLHSLPDRPPILS